MYLRIASHRLGKCARIDEEALQLGEHGVLRCHRQGVDLEYDVLDGLGAREVDISRCTVVLELVDVDQGIIREPNSRRHNLIE